MNSSPKSHGASSILVTVAVSLILFPMFFFVWFVIVSVFANIFIVSRWDEASWWKPIGYYATGALFILLAMLFLFVDIKVGIRVGRSISRGKLVQE